MSGRKMAIVAFAGLMFAFGSFAMAQDAGGGGGGGGGRGNRGGGQGGGNFDPAQMRQRMMDRMKEQLGATDDEWKVLLPKVEKVMTAQRDARSGGGMMGGRGGRGGPDQAPTTALGKATQDLRTTLENKDAKADEISAKLKAYREARETAQAELAKAQKELKEVLTLRQEAQLVLSSTLE